MAASVSPAATPQRDLVPMPKVAAGTVPIGGEYWALIVGINKYEHAPPLDSAVKDATGVREVLMQRYGFKRERVVELLDGQATRTNIESALFRMGQQAKADDSVLIYYAGHGQYDEDGRIGWWVPVEAQPKNPGTFITNASIRDYIEGMKAKHVYLVADSCFSGTLFGKARAMPPLNEQFFTRLYAKKSRWGLTSGGTEPVADAGKNGHSIFAYHFINLLKENRDPYLVPSHIYGQIAPVIANNAEQTPRSEPLRNTGDEGGQFVFRLATGAAAKLPKASAPSAPTTVEAPDDPGPSAALTQAEQELKALEKQERQVEAQQKLAAVQQEIERKKQQIEEKKNAPIQEARVRPPSAPGQTGRESTGQDGARMALVPAGDFLYGNDQQRLTLPAFYMDQYELTTTRYAKFMQATGRAAPQYWATVVPVSYGDRPVVGVDWHDADAYCRWAGKRLPTEQEWEKAARGTDGRTYPWGNEEPTQSLASYDWDGKRTWQGYATLATVESYDSGKSPYGIYNMAGNVWEWTSSDYDSSGKSKVFRGGSWTSHALYLRSSDRYWYTATNRHYLNGFRCAQDSPK